MHMMNISCVGLVGLVGFKGQLNEDVEVEDIIGKVSMLEVKFR